MRSPYSAFGLCCVRALLNLDAGLGKLVGSNFGLIDVYSKAHLIPDSCPMKKISTQLAFGILGIAGTLGIFSFQTAMAQNSSRDANVYGNTQSGDRPASGFGSGSSDLGNMFDLFHRAVLGTPRNSSEFGQDQQNNIGSEASDFRQRQQELLRQQQEPIAPQATPTPGNTPLQGN